MSLQYPVTLSPDENGTIIAEFPDIPGALTVGRDEANALEWAKDALLVMLSGIMDQRRPIPLPSPASPGQPLVEVPPMAEAKLTIYQAMLDQGVSQLKMASLLLTDARQIRRLLDLNHHSRFDQIEMALAVLGFHLTLNIRRAA